MFYGWGLLLPAFCTGLLGGSVYVGAYSLIAERVEPCYKELCMVAATIGMSFGTVGADIIGVFLQACIWKANHIEGAWASC